jgi:putative hydroxymethylpyrimidine transport system substrate-binding protein
MVIFSVLIFLAAGSGNASAMEKLTLMLDWFPNIDHLPIYTAKAEGMFAKRGIEVEVISPSDTSDALKLAAAGNMDLAVSYEPQSIIAAADGIPLRVVGRLVGHPLTTLLYLDTSGIRTPADLTGKTIGYTVPGLMDVLLKAFADINHIRDYQAVNVGFAIAQSLTSGRVDAVMGPFKTYETVTMGQKGIATSYFELEMYGIPDYDELVFATGPETLRNRRAAIAAFVSAIDEALAFIRKHPDAAMAGYFREVPDADRVTETAAFKLTTPYYARSQEIDAVRWQDFADFALKYGLIERPVNVNNIIVELQSPIHTR